MYSSERELINDLKKAVERDETLPEKVTQAKNAGEVQELLKQVGMELDDKEASSMFDEIKRQLANELDETLLENVSGGSTAVAVVLMAGGVAFLIGVARGARCKR